MASLTRSRTRTRLLAVALALLLSVAAGCSGGSGAAEPRPDPTTAATLPPAPEPDGEVVSGFVAFGDFGGGDAQPEVARAMGRWAADRHRVDALVSTGDNVYNSGEPEKFRAQLDEIGRAHV